MARVLVTGSTGQLGADLCRELVAKGHQVIGFDRTYDVGQVRIIYEGLCEASPELVIHCAALTNVDACEFNPSEAVRINVQGTDNVAAYCSIVDIPMIFISTDQVFSGSQNDSWGDKFFYREGSNTAPVNIYGMTKLLAERIVQQKVKKHFILRTAWLYGSSKNNYVNYYRDLSHKKLLVPDCQGNPTSTLALSEMISKLIDKMPESGVYNAVCGGAVYKYSLARFLNPKAKIIQVEPGAGAPRPRDTDLSNAKLSAIIGRIPTWQEALEQYIGASIGK